MKKKSKTEQRHDELVEELVHLRKIASRLNYASKELDKDLREARILLFMAMAVLLGILGLVLGISARFLLCLV